MEPVSPKGERQSLLGWALSLGKSLLASKKKTVPPKPSYKPSPGYKWHYNPTSNNWEEIKK